MERWSRTSGAARGRHPGEWVRTRVGFGAVSSTRRRHCRPRDDHFGHEMYWERETIAEIGGQPPASTEDDEATDGTKTEEISRRDEAILVLTTRRPPRTPDEQQK